MNSQIGLVFGVIAMAGWGIADFLVAEAVRKVNSLKIFVWSQIIGLVPYIPALFIFTLFPKLSMGLVAIILLSGMLTTVAYLSYYKGLQVGKVSIISPVAACWSVVTVVLSSVFLNEHLSPIQVLGVSLAITGAVATSFRARDLMKLSLRNAAVGVKYAFIALVSWGLYYVLLDILVAELSWFLPVLIIRIVTVTYLLIYSKVVGSDVVFPKDVKLIVSIIGFLEFVAFISYGIGVNLEYTAIVSPVSAASPMITIILARIVFRESMETNQKIGIALVLISLILLFM